MFSYVCRDSLDYVSLDNLYARGLRDKSLLLEEIAQFFQN